MLKLVKEKENLLVEKYGFEKHTTIDNCHFYRKKGLKIFSDDYTRRESRVDISSLSKEGQDVLYDMIIDGVVKKVPNIDLEMEKKRLMTKINKLNEQLEKAERAIKELER